MPTSDWPSSRKKTKISYNISETCPMPSRSTRSILLYWFICLSISWSKETWKGPQKWRKMDCLKLKQYPSFLLRQTEPLKTSLALETITLNSKPVSTTFWAKSSTSETTSSTLWNTTDQHAIPTLSSTKSTFPKCTTNVLTTQKASRSSKNFSSKLQLQDSWTTQSKTWHTSSPKLQ